MSPPASQPVYIDHRIALFDQLKTAAARGLQSRPIKVSLPDGKILPDTLSFSPEHTPYLLARSLSKSLADRTIIAKVNGVLWDLHRPLEDDCTLELLDWSNDESILHSFP
ncbi:MAG: hypothetical protein SGCHY_004975 [Lobulomycetales sp.]